jgi:YfiH family protein
MLTARTLENFPNVRYGFFTRMNGFSSGLYTSLNCGLGSDDHPDAVRRNLAYCAGCLGVRSDRLVTAHQQHTADIVTVTDPWPSGAAPVADGLVTDRPNIALAVLAADCTPVLFADSTAKVIGAAHAGWKGAHDGVVQATVEAMIARGAEPGAIHAAIGPCIDVASYEVGPEFRTRFVDKDASNSRFFRDSNKKGHAYFDLRSYVADLIAETGIGHVEHITADTYAEEDRFFSYRRSCLRNEPDYGRQLSGIALVA